jgi:hypothetical protein
LAITSAAAASVSTLLELLTIATKTMLEARGR